MELHDPDIAKAYETLIYREELNPFPLDNHLSSTQTQEIFETAQAAEAPATDSGNEYEAVDNHSAHSQLLERRGSGVSRKEDHEPAMHRSFSPLAGLALGFSITNSWVGYLSCFRQNLAYAGPQSVVFGLMIGVTVQFIISLGLAEMASCFPSSGGQYHFVYILAPKNYKKFAAFLVGWMNLLGWTIATCSGVSVVIASVSGMASFWDSSFQVTQSQLYLMYLATIILTFLPLFLGPRRVPKVIQASFISSLIGFFVVFGLVITQGRQTQPLSSITTPRIGTSGWGMGVAWTMGISNAMYPFVGTDAVIHIAEEMKRPERNIPIVIILTLTIGFFTAFPLLLAMMLGMTDINAVIDSPFPYAELLYQITGSKLVTTAIMCWVSMILYSALIGQWITCGRLAWAFARDHGLPWSNHFSHISERYEFPLRTTILSLSFCALYGLLYIISTTAFNSIITSSILYLNITYAIPQALIAIRGRAKVLPARPFNLGRLGYICNFLSPILVLGVTILVCLPPELPVTKANINYSPVVLIGLFLVILGLWFATGHKFRGPRIEWEMGDNVKIT